jgi:pimeloyl-ACP methyl ester carboxylesterase
MGIFEMQATLSAGSRRGRARLAVVTLTALISTPRAYAQAPPPPSALSLSPCASEGAMKDAWCGAQPVPEDPRRPEGRQIALRIVVLRALSPTAGAAPLFHLEGGPGVAASGAAGFYLGPGSGYRRTRDVVLVDQRGTGGSNALRCPKLEARSPLDDYEPVEQVAECRRDLEARADLTQYSTENAADDLDRVRAALGHDRIDLWALSYGTRLAQVYLKRFGAHVRSAVLMGFAPLDYKAPLFHAVAAQRVLDLVLDGCQLDPACAARYPDLRGDWRSVLARLESEPAAVQAPDGSPQTVRRGPFGEAIRTLLSTAAGQSRLPNAIHRAAGGDFAPFLAMLAKGPPGAEGLYLTIACSEGGARIADVDVGRHTAGTFLDDYRVTRERAACAAWRTYPVPESFYVPPASATPILVFTGSMDHVTPPDWAQAFCTARPSCRLVPVPYLGHGPFDLDRWTHGECLDDIMLGFYEHPGPSRPSACAG